MEAELRKLLEPIITKFIDSIIKVKVDYENSYKAISENLTQELEITKKERISLKTQKEENENVTCAQKEKLNEEIAKQTILNNKLKEETAKYSKLSKEYEEKIKAIEDNLKSSKIEREETSKALEGANNLKKEFETKLIFLKEDSDKLASRKVNLDNREKDIKHTEGLLLKQETDLIEKGRDLGDRDLLLQSREAEVNRLIKRYKLEQSIKGE